MFAGPKKNTIYARHQESMAVLGDYILTTGLWTDGFASAMEDMLLSPTFDINDQQLLVSCITLSAINLFDMAKFRVLVNVYQKSTDESLRQRTFVGWMFSPLILRLEGADLS